MANIDDIALYPGSDSESGQEPEWIFGREFLDVVKATLKLSLNPPDKSAKVATEIRRLVAEASREKVGDAIFSTWCVLCNIVSQIPHDSQLQDILADAVGILKSEGGRVWTSSDDSKPFEATWDELPDLAMFIHETHLSRSIPSPYDKEPFQDRRNWCAFLARLQIRGLSADVLTVWEFAEVLEGGMKHEGQRTEHLKGPAMHIGLCIVRDRIVIAGQQLFNHLRDVAARKDVTEETFRSYEPGVMCDSQKISGWGLSRWRFWTQMLRRIRDKLLGELDLVGEEVVPIINETLDRMEAIEKGAGPIEGDNWPKLLHHNNDKEGKQENEKNVTFEEEAHGDKKVANGGWVLSCVVS
ncbi:hypothetical protein PspLS_08509 [Pyricularia sp. CBS 133598]|nr:hypothetical protein PspLS_08509 [Pyricularia sp. CBS 133598]